MRFSVVLCSLMVAVVAAQSGDYAVEDDVLVLTKDSFEQAVRDFKALLVEFCKFYSEHTRHMVDAA